MSLGSQKERPARAVLRNSCHQPSCMLSQQAPTGMKAWWMRGWSSSQVRVDRPLWEGWFVGADPDLPVGVDVFDVQEKLLVKDAVTGGRAHGDLLSVPDT